MTSESEEIMSMHPYPHTYVVSAQGGATGSVEVSSAGLHPIQTSSPPQFDGPEGVWSPETLLCAAVADCLVLTFRGLSRAARFEWRSLECRVEGTLERTEGVSRFTRYAIFADLKVPEGTDLARAKALLERAEHSCLISNSLRGTRDLEIRIGTGTEPEQESMTCTGCGLPEGL